MFHILVPHIQWYMKNKRRIMSDKQCFELDIWQLFFSYDYQQLNFYKTYRALKWIVISVMAVELNKRETFSKIRFNVNINCIINFIHLCMIGVRHIKVKTSVLLFTSWIILAKTSIFAGLLMYKMGSILLDF